MNSHTNLPLGFAPTIPQGQYYCSAGSTNAYGRNMVEQIFKYAADAGILVSGMNAEVAPGQWEIQVGPLTGISASDHLWVLRYIMERATEEFNVWDHCDGDIGCYIELHPKPVTYARINKVYPPYEVPWTLPKEWNGSGAHTNYSTKSMREPGGLAVIHSAIDKLKAKHSEHMLVYGEFNKERLCGKCETSSYDKFSSGVADRSASVRIPTDVMKKGCGYLEDRRPSSIMDPYLVTSKLFETTVLST